MKTKKNDLVTILNRNHKQGGVTVIGEPQARNTAPAVGLVAWFLHAKDPQSVMAVLPPSDHYVEPNEQFVDLLKKRAGPRPNTGWLHLGSVRMHRKPAMVTSAAVMPSIHIPTSLINLWKT